MTKHQEFLAHAAECRAWAVSIAYSRSVRDGFLVLADQWEDLARGRQQMDEMHIRLRDHKLDTS